MGCEIKKEIGQYNSGVMNQRKKDWERDGEERERKKKNERERREREIKGERVREK